MNEQKLISAIDKLIDAGLAKGGVVKQEDIARRAFAACASSVPESPSARRVSMST